jgi:hypothetical protein
MSAKAGDLIIRAIVPWQLHHAAMTQCMLIKDHKTQPLALSLNDRGHCVVVQQEAISADQTIMHGPGCDIHTLRNLHLTASMINAGTSVREFQKLPDAASFMINLSGFRSETACPRRILSFCIYSGQALPHQHLKLPKLHDNLCGLGFPNPHRQPSDVLITGADLVFLRRKKTSVRIPFVKPS